MSACPTLETENLVLRPFKDEDVDDYFGVLDSPEVRRLLHLPESLDRHLKRRNQGNLLDGQGCIDLNVMTGQV